MKDVVLPGVSGPFKLKWINIKHVRYVCIYRVNQNAALLLVMGLRGVKQKFEQAFECNAENDLKVTN